MTTRRTRIHGKIIDPKKFENLPYHKGPVNMPAEQTMKKSEEELKKERDFNIKYAAKWGKEDVNKAIKQIENEIDPIDRQVKMVSNLSGFFGLPKKKEEIQEEVLDKWRKPKYYDYDDENKKFLESLANKKGGKRKTRKTRRKRGANYEGRVIFLDFNIEKMKKSGIIPEIYTYADNLNLLHKYRVLEDKGRFLKLMHIDDKEYKGLKLPMSFVKNGIVTIQIIPKKMGGRKTRRNKRSKKRRVKKRKTRKRRRKRR